jgi:uncharacterized cupredoxin-like copper-binding protein
MIDPTRDPATPGPPATPRWVKALGLAAIVAVLLVVIVMVVAGGEHGPARHTGSGDAGVQTPVASDPLTARGVGGPADAAEAARTVEVAALDTMTFEPSTIEVSAGETVTFRVTNSGQAVHEFTLGDAAMQQEHADAMAHMPDGMAHDLPNSITLQPGETKQLTWGFGHVRTVEYGCHEAGHYASGMRGQITVG